MVTALILVLSLISGCAGLGGGRQEVKESFTLQVVETSDLHGSIFPYDFINDKTASTSLAQVASYVREQREVAGQEVLLLDNGDILQGQPIVYYYNFEATEEEHIQASVMNWMGYAAASVGNHDIEAGHPVYDRIVDEFDFPWLAANAVDEKTGEPYFEAYTVVNMHGAKIAILGMITPGIPNWLPEDIWKGIRFDDMIETAEKWVPIIQEKEKPDLIIGLFHAGVDYTYSGSRDEKYNENASALVAEMVPGFDLIFTGHDHKDTNMTVTDPSGKTVHILGALNAGRTVAAASVGFEYLPEQDDFAVSVIEANTVMMDGYDPDPAFIGKFADAKLTVKDYVSKPIGEFTKTISTRPSMFGDSAFVDLIHDIQLEITGADLSFCAPLSLDAEIEEGTVYVRDMFNLYKYENLLYTIKLTGTEVKKALEYSYGGWFNTMTGPDDRLINYKKDDSGNLIWDDRYNTYETVTRYYNYDSAQGIDYTVDVSKPAGERLTIRGFSDGRPFDLDETYMVAINSYRGNGGGGHLTRGAGIDAEQLSMRINSSTVKDLRYYLLKTIENSGSVTPKADGNWSVVPEAWWENARERDYASLFEGKK
jgi:2',3'-cyclic-nucleotide 2'-phosphodiesterase/3'-nucleotidase